LGHLKTCFEKSGRGQKGGSLPALLFYGGAAGRPSFGRNTDLPLKREAGWYKDAIIYQVHVRTFFDSNGDGIGGFSGSRAEAGLRARNGVNAICLMPFFPSPLRDDGYDISITNPCIPATERGRLQEFLSGAHDRGIR